MFFGNYNACFFKIYKDEVYTTVRKFPFNAGYLKCLNTA